MLSYLIEYVLSQQCFVLNFLEVDISWNLTDEILWTFLNPFAPEPPVTTRADPGPFYPLWRHQF